jgi:predicted small metal-binding protein
MGIKCNFVATGETRDEVMNQISEHSAKAHPKEMKEMADKMSKEEMDQKMMENMQEMGDEM